MGIMYSAPTNHISPAEKPDTLPATVPQGRTILIRHRPTCVSDSEVADDQKGSDNRVAHDTKHR